MDIETHKASYRNMESWQEYANCRGTDPNIFFPSDVTGVDIAKRICNECVVREDCLEFALSTRQDHGVWGGMSERQRRRILKQRNRLN